ncbi:MAG TPA: dihydrofolate reductase family protein [Hyphomicrobium sp.]|jgi:dihydrofolate reductase
MARVRFYVATSLDGFIADREGSVDWLAPYDARLYGYDRFLGEVGALIMGRRTYEMIRAIGEDWPYAGKPVFVLASRSLGDVPPGVVQTTRGIRAALQQARETTRHDIWIVGGAVSMQSALEDGLVDMIEIFLVPVLLGAGLNLLNDLSRRPTLIFDGIEAFPDGVVKLRYLVPHR